jgi:hypothetical protein
MKLADLSHDSRRGTVRQSLADMGDVTDGAGEEQSHTATGSCCPRQEVEGGGST